MKVIKPQFVMYGGAAFIQIDRWIEGGPRWTQQSVTVGRLA